MRPMKYAKKIRMLLADFVGCAGSSLLFGLSLVAVRGGYSLAVDAGFSLPGTSLIMEQGSGACGLQVSIVLNDIHIVSPVVSICISLVTNDAKQLIQASS